MNRMEIQISFGFYTRHGQGSFISHSIASRYEISNFTGNSKQFKLALCWFTRKDFRDCVWNKLVRGQNSVQLMEQ